MEKWTIDLGGKQYIVKDALPDYEVIFPDGSYRILIIEHDGDQNETFRFDDGHNPDLAAELGVLIMNKTT